TDLYDPGYTLPAFMVLDRQLRLLALLRTWGWLVDVDVLQGPIEVPDALDEDGCVREIMQIRVAPEHLKNFDDGVLADTLKVGHQIGDNNAPRLWAARPWLVV